MGTALLVFLGAIVACALWVISRGSQARRDPPIERQPIGDLPVRLEVVRPGSPADLAFQAADLQKEATALHDNGQLEEAIRRLRDAARIDPDQLIARALRLPLWLQEAGRIDDARAEFEALIADVPRRVAVSIPRRKDRRSIEHAELAAIYDKMRLAYKREGRLDEAEAFGLLAAKHGAANQRAVRTQIAREQAERWKGDRR